ncbi:MAG: hypothetical protein HY784_14540, partial [Chloroflexi bacterium]|nr:hypothetical protein [Chloroflexota bacterium]
GAVTTEYGYDHRLREAFRQRRVRVSGEETLADFAARLGIPGPCGVLLPWGRGRGAGGQGGRGAGGQGSRGAGEQGGRGAGEQGSRGAGEQGAGAWGRGMGPWHGDAPATAVLREF